MLAEGLALFSQFVNGLDFSRVQDQLQGLPLLLLERLLHLLHLFLLVLRSVSSVLPGELGLVDPLRSPLQSLVEHGGAFRFPVLVVHQLRGYLSAQLDLLFDGRKGRVRLSEEPRGRVPLFACKMPVIYGCDESFGQGNELKNSMSLKKFSKA